MRKHSRSKKLGLGLFGFVFIIMVLGLPGISYPVTALDGFAPNANGTVYAIAIQEDRKILIGGIFTQIGGVTRNYIDRLNPDGSLDTAFDPNANSEVKSIAIQADGKILIGGNFTNIGGVTRNYIARITNTDAAFQELEVSTDGSIVAWMRGQASPEVWRVTFEHSADGITWTSLGKGTRKAGGWKLTGLSLPVNQNHYVRARGYATGGIFNSSQSIFESLRMVFIPPVPDLIETAISNPPPSATAGNSFSVTDTVINQGAVSAGASITNYYLSFDAAKGSGDILLTGSRSVTSLQINGTNTGTITITIPSITAPGSYYLLACADDLNQVNESNENNNCIASSGRVALQPVDYSLLTVSPSGTGSGTVIGNGINCAWNAISVSGTCSVSLAVGTAVSLASSAAEGSTFEGWSGSGSSAAGCRGTGGCTFTINEPTGVGARFALLQAGYCSLTVNPFGTGRGTVTGNGIDCAWDGSSSSGTCSVSLADGTSVSLSASSGSGSTFGGWSGGSGSAAGCNGTGACAFNITETSGVGAPFTIGSHIYLPLILRY